MGLRSLKGLYLFLFLAAFVVACNSGSSSDPTATATTRSSEGAPTEAPSATEAPDPIPTSPPTEAPATEAPSPTAVPSLSPTPPAGPATGVTEPDGDRILQDVITLSASPRSSATQLERVAAEEIADRLRGLGYQVSLQEFSVGTQQGRSALLGITSPQERTIPSLPIENSPTSTVEGRLVYVPGLGEPNDFPAEVDGAIALIQRGTLFFQEKIENAADAGAIGVVIYNNEPGNILASADSISIPAVTISQNFGQQLVTELASTDLTAELGVGPLSSATSQNVIAKPPGADCETITGGHYDSVPQANGASDNASGTATVLEIAAILINRGTEANHCFVLFGAEELGLLGSRHFVQTLTEQERGRIRAMLNLDMVGVGDVTWWLIGNGALQQQMGAIADNLGIETQVSNLVGTSSDHASFISGGIPALMLHRWQDPLLHTPQDVSSRVRPELLEQAATMGVALLEALGNEG